MNQELYDALAYRINHNYNYADIEAEFVGVGYTPEQVQAFYAEVQQSLGGAVAESQSEAGTAQSAVPGQVAGARVNDVAQDLAAQAVDPVSDERNSQNIKKALLVVAGVLVLIIAGTALVMLST